MRRRRRVADVLGVRAEVADTFFSRLMGLMFRSAPPGPGRGLLITRCRSIHTLFMRFPIDAVFLDGDGSPVKIVRDIPPWRPFVWGGRRATQVLELRAGSHGIADGRSKI